MVVERAEVWVKSCISSAKNEFCSNAIRTWIDRLFNTRMNKLRNAAITEKLTNQVVDKYFKDFKGKIVENSFFGGKKKKEVDARYFIQHLKIGLTRNKVKDSDRLVATVAKAIARRENEEPRSKQIRDRYGEVASMSPAQRLAIKIAPLVVQASTELPNVVQELDRINP